jgi:hypothetical protein
MKLEFSPQIFEQYSNIQFHKTPSIGNKVVPRKRRDGRTDRQKDRQTEIQIDRQKDTKTDMELTLVFCNFAKAPKKEWVSIAYSRENCTPKQHRIPVKCWKTNT